jgi:hypothetical protein
MPFARSLPSAGIAAVVELNSVGRKPIEIGVYELPQSMGASHAWCRLESGQFRSSRSASTNWLAAMGAVVINACAMIIMGTATSPDRLPTTTGTSKGSSDGLMVSVISIDRAPSSDRSLDRASVAWSVAESLQLLEPLRADLSLDGASPESVTVITDDAQSETERLEGIYKQQIAARIDRELETAHIARNTSCTVLVEQTTGGRIVDITLEQCSGDLLRQQRLLMTIRQASPLPASPRSDIVYEKLKIQIGKAVSVQM